MDGRYRTIVYCERKKCFCTSFKMRAKIAKILMVDS